MNLFHFQLIISFILGGSLIAVVGYFAEHAHQRHAAIIMSIPSTILVSLLFIGITVSPQAVAEVAPGIPAVIGVIVGPFLVTYLYASKIHLPKIASIALSAGLSIMVWLIFSLPIAYFEVNNLSISLLLYTLGVSLGYYTVTRAKPVTTVPVRVAYGIFQKLLRAVFAGSLVAFSVYISHAINPFLGGIFSAFPASFLSNLAIMHYYHNSDFLFRVWRNVPVTSILCMVYPLFCALTFPAVGAIWGTVVGFLFSIAIVLVLLRRR